MKIYTKVGDKGQTSLFGGEKVAKDHVRVAAYGEVDALNAELGRARASNDDREIGVILERLQSELFDLGGELATPPSVDTKLKARVLRISQASVHMQEQEIDRLETELAPLKTFILPGGTAAAADLHVARTACRRAERAVVRLHAQEPVRPEILQYLNRLSDFLFVMARVVNKRAGVADIAWLSSPQ